MPLGQDNIGTEEVGCQEENRSEAAIDGEDNLWRWLRLAFVDLFGYSVHTIFHVKEFRANRMFGYRMVERHQRPSPDD